MRSAMRLHLDFKLHSRAKSCSVTLLHMHADRSKMPIFHDAAAAPRRRGDDEKCVQNFFGENRDRR